MDKIAKMAKMQNGQSIPNEEKCRNGLDYHNGEIFQ